MDEEEGKWKSEGARWWALETCSMAPPFSSGVVRRAPSTNLGKSDFNDNHRPLRVIVKLCTDE